jgi:PPOX class probable F420-dependent enzyme
MARKVPRSTLTQAEAEFIQLQRVARLASMDADGHPHIVPICYVFDGSHFYTPLDEKPKRVNDHDLRRVRNIAQHPEVALLFDRYEEDWSRLGYVLIRGGARLMTPQELDHHRALILLRERYPQYLSMALEGRPVIVITPKRISSWGAVG